MNRRDLQHLWQIRTDQVAAVVQLRRVSFWAVTVELFLPFHHVGVAPVLLDQPADAVAAFALATRAFDSQYVELAFNVAEYGPRIVFDWPYMRVNVLASKTERLADCPSLAPSLRIHHLAGKEQS